MTVRAKVRCTGVATFESWYKGKQAVGRTVKFAFVMDDGTEENKRFWEASPSTNPIEITIANPDAGKQFELGMEYYIDFIPSN